MSSASSVCYFFCLVFLALVIINHCREFIFLIAINFKGGDFYVEFPKIFFKNNEKFNYFLLFSKHKTKKKQIEEVNK